MSEKLDFQTVGCAQCGDCCDSIYLAGSKSMMLKKRKLNPTDDRLSEDITFIAKHWHGGVRYGKEGKTKGWRCDQFDTVTRKCKAHDERPPICRDFPWYSGGPMPTLEFKHCSYWHDVPLDQWLADTDPLPIPVSIRV